MVDALNVLVDTMHEHIQDVMRQAIESGNLELEMWAIRYYNDVLFYTKQYWEEHYDE